MTSVDALELFKPLGYKVDTKVSETLDGHGVEVVCSRYHGMGHVQVLCAHKSRRSPNKYFLGVLGGSDGYAAQDNHNIFVKTVKDKSKYLTLEEVFEYALYTMNNSIYTTYEEMKNSRR